MGRDKRVYRLVQDTSYGRRVLEESGEVEPIVEAVTQYIARRLVERERSLAAAQSPLKAGATSRPNAVTGAGMSVKAFFFGLIVGIVALFAFAWMFAPESLVRRSFPAPVR